MGFNAQTTLSVGGLLLFGTITSLFAKIGTIRAEICHRKDIEKGEVLLQTLHAILDTGNFRVIGSESWRILPRTL